MNDNIRFNQRVKQTSAAVEKATKLEKVNESKGLWQIANTVIPVLIVLLFGFLFQWIRKRKFTA